MKTPATPIYHDWSLWRLRLCLIVVALSSMTVTGFSPHKNVAQDMRKKLAEPFRRPVLLKVMSGDRPCKRLLRESDLLASRGNRREFFWRSSLLFLLGSSPAVVATLFPAASQATYSAYARREQDWEGRQQNGEIQYSSPRQLRKQLGEMVPQNSEKSKLFCPNGPTAAVSPLMENRCGDRLATPSVYGRSTDVVGNSIPGFSEEWKTSIIDQSGGFPEYKGTKGGKL